MINPQPISEDQINSFIAAHPSERATLQKTQDVANNINAEITKMSDADKLKLYKDIADWKIENQFKYANYKDYQNALNVKYKDRAKEAGISPAMLEQLGKPSSRGSSTGGGLKGLQEGWKKLGENWKRFWNSKGMTWVRKNSVAVVGVSAVVIGILYWFLFLV